jgi:ribonuclease HI
MATKNFAKSFNGELYAIRQALYHMNKYEMNTATIFADSKFSIQAITNLKWYE